LREIDRQDAVEFMEAVTAHDHGRESPKILDLSGGTVAHNRFATHVSDFS